MIRIARSRSPVGINKNFTGNGLLNKLSLLAQAHANGPIAWTGTLGDWKKMKPALRRESFNKCAYCEANTAVVAHGDVEHFRPKSIYWWLAFCVDNYVFACQLCNQTHKGDRFPVFRGRLPEPKIPNPLPTAAAQRRQALAALCPDPAAVDDLHILRLWAKESACLPHPYLEDPEELFAWKEIETNGQVLLVPPRRASARARRAVKAAEECLGLNREILSIQRYKVFALLRGFIAIWESGKGRTRQIASDSIHLMCGSDQQFSGMCRYFARQAGFPI